jgi:hypothetical protein
VPPGTEGGEATTPRQRLDALERANEVRRARADLKRQIGSGELTAAQVIRRCPPEAWRWSVAEALASQRNWGPGKARKFLTRHRINEMKAIGDLTERQRTALAAALERSAAPTR